MKCPVCGSINDEGVKFCGGCGEILTGYLKCPKCGRLNRQGNKFCNDCGSSLSDLNASESAPSGKQAGTQPVSTPGTYAQPASNQNAYSQPVSNQNTYAQPASNQNAYAQPVTNQQVYQQQVSQGTVAPKGKGFGEFVLSFISYPGTWFYLVSFVLMLVFAFGDFLSIDWWYTSKYTTFEFKSFINNLDEFFDTGLGWMKFLLSVNNVTVIVEYITGIISFFTLLTIYNKYYSKLEWIGSLGIWAFGIGRVMTLIVVIACVGEDSDYIKVNWMFWVSIIAYVAVIISYSKTVAHLYSFTREALNSDDTSTEEWICIKCGRRNSGIYKRCECGNFKPENQMKAASEVKSYNEWICIKCGRTNSGVYSRCECGNMRY